MLHVRTGEEYALPHLRFRIVCVRSADLPSKPFLRPRVLRQTARLEHIGKLVKVSRSTGNLVLKRVQFREVFREFANALRRGLVRVDLHIHAHENAARPSVGTKRELRGGVGPVIDLRNAVLGVGLGVRRELEAIIPAHVQHIKD